MDDRATLFNLEVFFLSQLVYYSTKSGNTRRFIEQLNIPALRIPVGASETPQVIETPFVLVTPTYGGGYAKGAVPPAVVRFLKDNKRYLRGVISGGNTNFGTAFGLAGKIIAYNCNVPNLYTFELFGTPYDILRVREGLAHFWSASMEDT